MGMEARDFSRVRLHTIKPKHKKINVKLKIKKVNKKQGIKNPCPECGAELVFEGGCNICKNCGWTKCD
jgi:ribonucleoside-diphosphate reductase alpha chain